MSVNYDIVYCKICKKRIPNPVRCQKYCCDECRKIGMRNTKRKDKYKRHLAYIRKKQEKQIKDSKPKVLSLSEIMKSAKMEGLQYGEYCLKHNLY